MAQSGLHIPAHQGSQLPIFDDVLADIGDEQSLEQSLSTFSSHIRRVSSIFAQGDREIARPDGRDGRRDRPRRGRRARPGDPRRDRLDRLPGDRHDAHRRPQDLRLHQPPGRERRRRVRPGDPPAALPPPHRRHRPVERPPDRPPPEPARAPRRPGREVPRAKASGKHLPELEIVQKLRKEAEDARQSALAAQAEAERSREALNQRLGDLQRRPRTTPGSSRPAPGSSPATASSSPGSATTAPAASSRSTRGRRPPPSPSA